jgi:hypothetical protein
MSRAARAAAVRLPYLAPIVTSFLRLLVRGIPLVATLWLAACGDQAPRQLTRAQLLDPTSCRDCHPQQYKDWSGSMHAYAAEDPVFIAMNRRAQRETGGQLGDFCVKCHAPVAVAEGAFAGDALPDVTTLPGYLKGVTCFACHATAAVEGTHNNPLRLASDGSLFGPFADPAPVTPHRSSYSPLFDVAQPASASACGSCHDIVNQHGAAVERTFAEWQQSLFADLKLGQTCARCHMSPNSGPASTQSTAVRDLRNHALAGVDVALTPFPELADQRQRVQALLDGTLSGTVCLTDDLKINAYLDNVGAGHSFPSGATPDRRLWVEVVAYAGAQPIFQSGVVPVGGTLSNVDDPDAWVIRDCLRTADGSATHLFWQAASIAPPNLIAAPVKQDLQDPTTFTRSHVRKVFPAAGTLPAKPDRITLRVFLKPIGDDILDDLVASGDLARGHADAVPTFQLGGLLEPIAEWTPEKASRPLTDALTRKQVFGCVSTSAQFTTATDDASSHARCP